MSRRAKEKPAEPSGSAPSGGIAETTGLVDMDRLVRMVGADPVTLTRTAGTSGRSSYRILPLQQVRIGRDLHCEICIEESGVSREHAVIDYHTKDVTVVDHGSTNGTYVNGQRVREAVLGEGDTLQVGSVAFEVTVGGASPPVTDELGDSPESWARVKKIREALKGTRKRKGGAQKRVISGKLKEVQLPMLLQILEAGKNSGTLVIKQGEREGFVFVDKGRPIHATLGEARGTKALFRLIGFADGRFALFHPGRTPEGRTLTEDFQFYLLEGTRELDEVDHYRKQLPGDDAVVLFRADCAYCLDTVPADMFDVLAAVKRFSTFAQIVDHCPLSDLTVFQILHMLLSEGVLVVEGDGSEASEPDFGSGDETVMKRAPRRQTEPRPRL